MANKYFSMSRAELERDGGAGADAELSRRARGSLKKRGLHSDSKGKITKGSSSRRYVKVKGPARSYPSHSGDPCCSCGHESWSEETRRAGDPCPRCGKDPDIDPKTGKIVGKINVAALGRSVSSARAKILAEALVAQAEAELKKHGTRKNGTLSVGDWVLCGTRGWRERSSIGRITALYKNGEAEVWGTIGRDEIPLSDLAPLTHPEVESRIGADLAAEIEDTADAEIKFHGR